MVEDIIVWFDAMAWVQDVRLALLHMRSSQRNPFVSKFDFEHAAEIAQEAGHRFGTFQNMECKALKEKLVDMEHSGSGSATLSKFSVGLMTEIAISARALTISGILVPWMTVTPRG